MTSLYITGVEYNYNKIFVTAGLASTMQSLGYSTAVYKPVETGVITVSNDLSFVKYTDTYIKTYFSYQLEKDLSPILSAAAEGLVMEKNVILKDFQKIQDREEFLFVDGYSSLATPFSKDFLEEDVVKILDLPVLFVVSAKNPDINNTLLSVNRAKDLKFDLRGIIINDYPEKPKDANIKLMPKLIEEYSDAKVLGILPYFEKNINPEDLITEILNNVDIESVFRLKIAKLN